MDYESSLERAMDEVPDFQAEESRLQVPDAKAEKDGAFTRLTNIGDIADALSRDREHLHRVVQRELGTNGQLEENWARYNGSFSASDFDAAIDAYIEQYVICSECGLPDTRLESENRTQMLRCEACGAFRPVQKSRKSTQQQTTEAIEEGETYELQITGTGRKGDGVAERGEYTIFVPNAQEGETVRAHINNISGNLAFAERVN